LAACPVTGAPGTAHGSPRLLCDDPESRSGAGGTFQAHGEAETDGSRPHRSYVELAAHPGAVPYARRCTRQALTAWHLGSIANDVEVVASELVTNSIRAAACMQPASPIALYVALGRCDLFVLVWDGCPDLPARRDHAEDAESGRGLELVSALSSEWGACAAQGGKVVWARFDLERQQP
jgi:anti-sigma regulatory factor (Ser/Thr protein kinase)